MKADIKAHNLSFIPFIDKKTLKEKVNKLGKKLRKQFKGKVPLLIGVLNGSFIFAADLMRAMNAECEITFIKLSSYEGMKSTAEIKTHIGLEIDVEGRDVVIVEDIIDTGNTLHNFLLDLQKFKPASVTVVALLVKPDALQHDLQIDYRGFDIPDKFVIGYGLDYNGIGRNLREIYQLKED